MIACEVAHAASRVRINQSCTSPKLPGPDPQTSTHAAAHAADTEVQTGGSGPSRARPVQQWSLTRTLIAHAAADEKLHGTRQVVITITKIKLEH